MPVSCAPSDQGLEGCAPSKYPPHVAKTFLSWFPTEPLYDNPNLNPKGSTPDPLKQAADVDPLLKETLLHRDYNRDPNMKVLKRRRAIIRGSLNPKW